MFAKLVVVVISFATMGAWLLSLRHERIQALSETTQAQLRIDRKDERLWMLRTKIAQRITPPQIEQMTAGLLDLQPIAPYKALTREQLAALTDDPPVGPPGLLNPELAVEVAAGVAEDVPGGGETSGGAGSGSGGAVAQNKAAASRKGAGSVPAKSASGSASKPATKAAKPTGKGTLAAPSKQTVPSKSAGSKPATTPGPKASPKPAPKPGTRQPVKTSPTRVAKNDSKSSQEN